MKLFNVLIALIGVSVLFSCVSTKRFKTAEARYEQLNGAYIEMQDRLRFCEARGKDSTNEFLRKKNLYESKINTLNEQIDFLKNNNDKVFNQLKDLSVISNAQAESIKKSLDNIGVKDEYIKLLQSAISRKDSLNMALVINLKGAIGDLNDKDINIKVDKGVVYVDISDKLLFKSGSYDITEQAKDVLGKVAIVMNNQPDIEFMVEGHTDDVAFNRPPLIDNWDLSVKRATSVVRILQTQYGITPGRMTAAGRSEFVPLFNNGSAESRAANRRTRIVILPQLDQFFKLLEKPQ